MAENKLKILFVLPFLPWPLSSGGHQAVYNGIKALVGKAEIHLVYYVGQFDRDSDKRKVLDRSLGGNVDIIPYIDRVKSWDGRIILKRLLVKIHRRVDVKSYAFYTRLHDQNYYAYVNSLVRDLSINLVQIDMMENIDFVLSLPESVKKVFVHHELRYERNRRFMNEWGGRDEYLKVLSEIERIKEVNLLNKYDTVITFSEIDKEKLLSQGVAGPVFVSSPVVDSTPLFSKNNASATISYVGPESHLPNKLGLIWFLDNVWPLVIEANSSFKLNIVGKWSSATLSEWRRKYKNIYFKGFVEDLSSIIRGTTMIVPVFVGSGIRMKILESISAGVPFVSTNVGAEGIPLVSGRDCYITDDPNEFAQNIIALEDEHLRNSFTEAAMIILKDHFSINRLSDERVSLYKKLAHIK